MRKTLAFVALLALCAAPAAAQQSGPAAPPEPVAAAANEQPAQAPAPSLFPTRDEVRAQVRAAEESRGSRGAMVEGEFIALVLAIIVGIVIAAVVLD
ncbi:MAG TPA: hypothetical protein VF092_13195 [Longimicrobium sp.]